MDRVLASTRTTPSPETVAASVPESAALLSPDPAGVDAEPLPKLCAKRFGQVDVPG
jgi:hypothetical protein